MSIIKKLNGIAFLLLGFPSHDRGLRGTVYWLALAAQPSLPEAK